MVRRNVVFFVLVISQWTISPTSSLPQCDFRAIYNFGDSNSDTGGISASFEPTVLPYGETFEKNLSGRATDGRLIIDFIAENLKLPYLSAYLNSIGTSYEHGANFATGGSTIRRQNETIYEYGISPFALDMQIIQFDQFRKRTDLLQKQGVNECEKKRLPRDFVKALYVFDIGQNDLSVGFRKMSNDQLRAALPDIVEHLAAAVKHLYDEGARAFWIHNTSPFGCLPVNLFYLSEKPGLRDEYGCLKAQNAMAIEFNAKLKERVTKLRADLKEAAVTYVDLYAAKYTLIRNAKKEGFTDPLKVCCGYHVNFDHVWCGKEGVVNKTRVYGSSCKDPSVFVSWDGVHYTEAANRWVADRTQHGSFTDPPIPITQACHRLQ